LTTRTTNFNRMASLRTFHDSQDTNELSEITFHLAGTNPTSSLPSSNSDHSTGTLGCHTWSISHQLRINCCRQDCELGNPRNTRQTSQPVDRHTSHTARMCNKIKSLLDRILTDETGQSRSTSHGHQRPSQEHEYLASTGARGRCRCK
jgi:hypothetical protein